MAEYPRRLEDLADELIGEILSFLLAAEHLPNVPSPVISPDLSPELNGQSTRVYGERSELDRFRLVCKQFLRISTPRKFQRFVLRFSVKGFQRLEELLNMQLACHVRCFTYMVRPFYQGSGWSHFNTVDPHDFPAAQVHKARLQEQTYILGGNQDLELLRHAIGAFSYLQQVKLLRLQDEADEQLLDYIYQHSLEGTLGLQWEPACTRAVANLSVALLASDCTSVRFVGPQLSPEATVRLLHTPSSTLSALGARLTSLDVTFYSNADITGHMGHLSNVCRDFFVAAQNLIAIHLGFVTKVPLDLPLEQIFHHVQWKRIRTLSIQGWQLSSEEIISFVRRHRRQLRDIRLVSIYLRGGSRWRDVLSVLRDDMDLVERIDLRGIDYTTAVLGDHVSGHHGISNGNVSRISGFQHPTLPLSVLVQDAETSPPTPPSPVHQAVLNTDHLGFITRGTTRSSFSTSSLEILKTVTADDLCDDGMSVKQNQRLFWEAWVLSSPRKVMQRNV